MPFPFVLVCDLLEQAHRQCKSGRKNLKQLVSDWFARHRRSIDNPTTDASALLSILLPDRRTDRVYGLQAIRLSNIVGRALGVSRTKRQDELRRFEKPGLSLDLADCIENILRETPNPFFSEQGAVTVEEIDTVLNSLAASCKFSSPAIQASQPRPGSSEREELVANLYKCLQAREAKWLTRLILKNYQPIMFDPGHVYYCYDPMLPNILRVQEEFSVALSLVQKLRSDSSFRIGGDLLKHLTPVLGVKVGRQPWLKGRSIKHCMNIGHGWMSCEKKIDGEYCQVHVDLSKGRNCIQIFSKSGKDSTLDRIALHGAICDSLDIGKTTCKLSRGCILEGELVVYSDKDKKILPFHKIRKYVSRSGRYLHTEEDSQRHHYEHLMIVYFDALLIDDESLLGASHSERFKRLTDLIHCREGHAELVERQVIRLDHPLAASHLRKAFAKSITARDEGLVLKPDDPYFNFCKDRRSFSSCPIKLKKEYIGSFGDVGDFAVVAARYDADKAKCYPIPNLQWTHFYLGCLDNKEDVERYQARPEFTVVHQVELNETLLKTVITYGRPMPVSFEDNTTLILRIKPGIAQHGMPSVVFTEPMVFDVRCFSFDKEGNTGFWQPRFPQISKVHFDRSFIDTISFAELQQIAEDATKTPAMEDSQELLDWIAALEGADPRGIPVDAISQSTTTSLLTPSRTSSVRPSTSPAPMFFESPSLARRSLPALLEVSETPAVPTPTALALKGTTTKPLEKLVNETTTEVLNTSKRAQGSTNPSSREMKRLRVLSESGMDNQDPPSSQARQPLRERSVNQDSSSPHASQQSVLGGHGETAPALPLQTQTKTVLPPSSDAQLRHVPAISKPNDRHTKMTQLRQPSLTNQKCENAGDNCLLANRIALLAPCIANQSWVTENLLASHGIREWTAELQVWINRTPPPTPSQSNKKRVRKICFVEHNRKEATRAFMKQILDNPHYLPSGKREWIEVYDWRLLEDISSLEKLQKGSRPLAEHPNPKRKWFVGLV
ncbi:ATP dependent dna ligase domain protein [Colletotrichum truncatum]|uniref:ATP dependent dna ligase domain protein n=1 Tax=Colletotrichum truncatum TaxID=5467 RepID=A0ACC3ZI09_COLTU|nr:ATP dependent dna ligase domain protein [Colletotrichum truncatum]KAF6786776.1 ATP dependent dna ligase domain protein [Colletotrichum truncatum]